MAEGKQIYAALQAVQRELKAPKGQFNSFGKYKYRSCEDIVEAVKPLLNDNGLILTMSDEVVEFGSHTYKKVVGDEITEVSSSRVYIKATATVTDIINGDKIEVTAMAREPEEKKGMDTSQITGTASSYARKYALNGLFAIDDTKDADTNEYASQNKAGATKQTQATPNKANTQTAPQSEGDNVRKQAVNRLNGVIKGKGLAQGFVISTAEKVTGKKSVKDMTSEEIIRVCEALEYEQ